MPRYVIGDPVTSAKHGAGEVVMVHDSGINDRRFYSVSFASQRHSVICHEPELEPATGLPEGTDRCADCVHQRTTTLMPGTCHCSVLARRKTLNTPRHCPTFQRRNTP